MTSSYDRADSTSVTGASKETRSITCAVCGDWASGRHYGVLSCDGCRGFFKRSVRRNMRYACKKSGSCRIDPRRRNRCQACRLLRCLEAGMIKEAVQEDQTKVALGLLRNAQISLSPFQSPWGFKEDACGRNPSLTGTSTATAAPATTTPTIATAASTATTTVPHKVKYTVEALLALSETASGVLTKPSIKPITPPVSPCGKYSRDPMVDLQYGMREFLKSSMLWMLNCPVLAGLAGDERMQRIRRRYFDVFMLDLLSVPGLGARLQLSTQVLSDHLQLSSAETGQPWAVFRGVLENLIALRLTSDELTDLKLVAYLQEDVGECIQNAEVSSARGFAFADLYRSCLYHANPLLRYGQVVSSLGHLTCLRHDVLSRLLFAENDVVLAVIPGLQATTGRT